MKKFYFGEKNSESLNTNSEEKNRNSISSKHCNTEVNDKSVNVPTNDNISEMNLGFRSKTGRSSLRDTQTALAAALEAMSLKERVISALEEEIKSQENEIFSLKIQLKECRTQTTKEADQIFKSNSDPQVRRSYLSFGGATPESTYSDLSMVFRPKRMAISAEPLSTSDSLLTAPAAIDKPQRFVTLFAYIFRQDNCILVVVFGVH